MMKESKNENETTITFHHILKCRWNILAFLSTGYTIYIYIVYDYIDYIFFSTKPRWLDAVSRGKLSLNDWFCLIENPLRWVSSRRKTK